jgi:alkylated DNA repair dioxygenase AlkB
MNVLLQLGSLGDYTTMSVGTYGGFGYHCLDDQHGLFVGSLPEKLRPDAPQFETLWTLQPNAPGHIMKFGRLVPLRRWHQAFGKDYNFAGATSRSQSVPPSLGPFLEWARVSIDERLNGLLVNWYDGSLEHSIGPHHDDTKDLVGNAPIVMISLGEERIFRLQQPIIKVTQDFPARDGTVFVLPYDTNKVWKHAVPHRARFLGRRISITIRAFQ